MERLTTNVRIFLLRFICRKAADLHHHHTPWAAASSVLLFFFFFQYPFLVFKGANTLSGCAPAPPTYR